MNEAEKVKAIQHIVHEVYMREHNVVLAQFLTRYANDIKGAHNLSMQVGIPIAFPPITLDLRPCTEQLVKNLVAFEILHKWQPPQK